MAKKKNTARKVVTKKKKQVKKQTIIPKLPTRAHDLLSEKAGKFNPHATKESCIADLRRVQNLHPHKSISRIFYRNDGKYSDATWNRFFGTFLEFRRQSGLELSRNQHALERHIAKHASLDFYREFQIKEVLPYHQKYKKKDLKKSPLRKIIFASDFHDEEVDLFALEIFIDQCKLIQPDVVILGGDIYDLYEFSRFDKDPRRIRIKERFAFVRNKIFAPVRRACPNAQIDLLAGNHELRLMKHLADKSPAVRVILSDVMGLTLADIFGLDEFKMNLISKLDLTAYRVRDVKDQIKENYEIYWDCFVACHFKDWHFGLSGCSGHHHRMSLETARNIPAGRLSWVESPGMHKLDAEYVGGLNKWNLGFNIIDIHLDTKEVIQSPCKIHENWAVVNGVFYKRKITY